MAKSKKKRRHGSGPRKPKTIAQLTSRPAPRPVNPLQAEMRVMAAVQQAQGYSSSAHLQTALQQAQRVAQRIQERLREKETTHNEN